MKRVAGGRFLHLELSAQTRAKLKKDERLRRTLLECLGDDDRR